MSAARWETFLKDAAKRRKNDESRGGIEIWDVLSEFVSTEGDDNNRGKVRVELRKVKDTLFKDRR